MTAFGDVWLLVEDFASGLKCVVVVHWWRCAAGIVSRIVFSSNICSISFCYIWRLTCHSAWAFVWYKTHSTEIKIFTKYHENIISTNTALCFERYTFRHVAGLVRHFSVLSLQAQWVMLKSTYSILCCSKCSTPKFRLFNFISVCWAIFSRLLYKTCSVAVGWCPCDIDMFVRIRLWGTFDNHFFQNLGRRKSQQSRWWETETYHCSSVFLLWPGFIKHYFILWVQTSVIFREWHLISSATI